MRCIAIAVFLLAAFDTTAERIVIGPGIRLDVPRGWEARRDTDATWLIELRIAGRIEATMIARVEERRNHAEAVRRLAEIDAEYTPKGDFFTHQGWPAFERKILAPLTAPDHEDPREMRRADEAWHATTAVAAGVWLVRLRTVLHPDADAELAEEALRIGRSLHVPDRDGGPADIPPARPLPKKPRAYASKATKRPVAGGAAPMPVNGKGEIEAAISMDGRSILTVAGCSMSYSEDRGRSFMNPGGSGALKEYMGDCSVAWGPSGTFYSSTLCNECVAFYSWSIPATTSFRYVGLLSRREQDIKMDQPHIVTDRWNLSACGKDRVYVVWQETQQWVSRIACSSTSGATWSKPVDANGGPGSYPRVAVGADGMVYVVSRGGENTIVIDKFSSCDCGLVRQSGFPVTIPISNVTCPIPGLDRCNNGNTLSSPTIAVDERHPSNVYLGYAQTNSSGGQDILVAQSTDGGLTFPNTVALNGKVTAVRFMPWLGAWNGVVYAGWYDRRNATPASNDLTSYYMNSVSVVKGTLTPGTEVDLSGADDPQCASGWANGARSGADACSCSTQPQLAGYCGKDGSNTRCDFRNPQCPQCGSCFTGDGTPKYGDYNGLAVSGGTLINIWATATAPSRAGSTPPSPPEVTAWVVVTKLP